MKKIDCGSFLFVVNDNNKNKQPMLTFSIPRLIKFVIMYKVFTLIVKGVYVSSSRISIDF